MARLITKLQLVSRLKGRTKSPLYRDCEPGGPLHSALVGSKIDLDHQAARIYCAQYDYAEPDVVAERKAAAQAEAKKRVPVTAPPLREEEFTAEEDDDADAEEILSMPLREVVARYGRQGQFKDYVTASKNLVQMQGLQEEQARRRGEYIHRVHVEKLAHLVDSLHKALLSDACTNIAHTTTALVKAGADPRKVEEAIRDTIGRIIKQTKAQVERGLRNV